MEGKDGLKISYLCVYIYIDRPARSISVDGNSDSDGFYGFALPQPWKYGEQSTLMKELQVAKVRDFKGESLLPTVRYRGWRNKKKKGKGTGRGRCREEKKERERQREKPVGDGRKLSRTAFNLPWWVTELENLRSSFWTRSRGDLRRVSRYECAKSIKSNKGH